MRLLLISALAAGVLASAGYGAPGGSAVQNVEAQPQQKNNAYEGKKEEKKEDKKEEKKEDKKEGKKEGDKAQEINIDIDIVVINKFLGGGSKTEELNKPASPGKTHSVTVGGPAGLVYSPETINANINDVVEFKFLAKNHTVTQSNFDKPCVKSGIDSGFMPNDGNVNPAPTYTFQVKSMKATWFYCKQRTGTHCGKGMTFSINPTAEKSHAKFKELAIQQNGTAEAGSSAAPPPPPASATPPPASAPPTPPPSQTASSNIVQGTGKVENGQCACQCLCGADSLQQGMGIGNYGGWGGQVPAACVPGQKEQKAPEAPPAAAPQASYSAPQSSNAAPSSAEASKSAPAGFTPIPQSSANGPGAIATGG
ncbi:MAG: hypothetical protein M1832_000060 [Thelocarpon impressellum]|nr:MAG: hypothetical protein M1832_000060 [Thelocarpon impressellum]